MHQNIQTVEQNIKQWRNNILEQGLNPSQQQLESNILKANLTILHHQTIPKQGFMIKSPMFVWQILNHSLIKNSIDSIMVLQQPISKLLTSTFQSRIQHELYHKSTLKCLLIFINNLYTRLKQSKDSSLKLIYLTLNGIFALQKLSNIKITEDEQEWIHWICLLVFNWTSFIKRIIQYHQQHMKEHQSHHRFQYNMLLCLNDLINSMIDARCTTQLILGYPCRIAQVCQMYSNNKFTQQVRISESDFQFLCLRLSSRIQQFISEIHTNHNNKIKKQDKQEQDNKMLVLMQIVCKVTFLGGYNGDIQRLCEGLVMKHLLRLLQATYLIYILTESNVKNVKLSVNNKNLSHQSYIQSLSNLINEPNLNVGHIHNIPDNIFPLTLRLLSNLVHINTACQKYFQQEIKYFHIVLSLTHNTHRQMTMREWAIIFIRHASQCSPTLRQATQKVQIDINTNQKNNFKGFHTVQL